MEGEPKYVYLSNTGTTPKYIRGNITACVSNDKCNYHFMLTKWCDDYKKKGRNKKNFSITIDRFIKIYFQPMDGDLCYRTVIVWRFIMILLSKRLEFISKKKCKCVGGANYNRDAIYDLAESLSLHNSKDRDVMNVIDILCSRTIREYKIMTLRRLYNINEKQVSVVRHYLTDENLNYIVSYKIFVEHTLSYYDLLKWIGDRSCERYNYHYKNFKELDVR